MIDLSSYKAEVKALFDSDSPLIITNRDKAHAAVLMTALLKRAKTDAVLFCKNLDAEFYDSPPIKGAILKAVDDGLNLQILVQQRPEANQLMAELSARRSNGNVEIKVCKPHTPSAEASINFAVVDSKAFRFESDRDNNTAFASANNPELANDILKLFAAFSEQGEVV